MSNAQYNVIESKFRQMGARVKVHGAFAAPAVNGVPQVHVPPGQWAPASFVPGRVRVDIRRDAYGAYFDVRHGEGTELHVLDVARGDRADRHLVLMAKTVGAFGRSRGATVKHKFLCGHDERSWFVAAVPDVARGGRRVSDVQSAKDALKPKAVWDAIAQHGVAPADRDRRRTAAFVRQGEWFFIPRPAMVVDRRFVLHDEPIRRGAGKPHFCWFLYREGGEQVFVNWQHPNGLTRAEFDALPRHERAGKHWQTMTRQPTAYAKGAVRHPDHATIHLRCWHEIVQNSETQAASMRHVAFLD
jgi:hypothetical protein